MTEAKNDQQHAEAPNLRELELELQLWIERVNALQIQAESIQLKAEKCQGEIGRLRAVIEQAKKPKQTIPTPPPVTQDGTNPEGSGGGPGEGNEGP